MPDPKQTSSSPSQSGINSTSRGGYDYPDGRQKKHAMCNFGDLYRGDLDEVEQLCQDIKDKVFMQYTKKKCGGLDEFHVFEPIEYITHEVAGVDYGIKIRVKDGETKRDREYIHVKVFKPAGAGEPRPELKEEAEGLKDTIDPVAIGHRH